MNIGKIPAAELAFSLAILFSMSAAGAGCGMFTSDPSWNPGEERPAYSAEALNFMVIGDWGVKGREYQKEVAQSMAMQAALDSSRFVISTGDNFYGSGVESVEDEHWTKSFEDIYSAPSLQVPWYVVLGNHDYDGNIQAQIDYTKRSERWTLPATYYSIEKRLADGTSILLVFIDTNTLRERVLTSKDISEGASSAAVQLQWLIETLSTSDADWKIVAGHHPLYSVGERHQDDEVLIENLAGVFDSNDVQMYLSGHAHNLQHFEMDGGVDYFISGAGAKLRDVFPNESTLAAFSVPGFLAVSMYPDYAVAQFIDLESGLQYEARVDR